MIIEGLEQGSSEWHAFRKKHIMASMSSTIMGVSKWSTPFDLFCEITGLNPPKECNAAMQRGLDLEGEARQEFRLLTGIKVVPVVMKSERYGWMAASLDGWDEATKTLVEIKCPGVTDHASAVKGIIPKHYIPQLVHQMIVAEVDKCYYFSYSPYYVKPCVLLELNLDYEDATFLIEKEKDFYQRLQEGDCP